MLKVSEFSEIEPLLGTPEIDTTSSLSLSYKRASSTAVGVRVRRTCDCVSIV